MTTVDRSKRFISFVQLQERWAGVSHMFIERLIANDPDFPAVHQMGPRGKLRMFDLDEIERYERASVKKRRGGNEAA